jgi:hypothetical protein
MCLSNCSALKVLCTEFLLNITDLEVMWNSWVCAIRIGRIECEYLSIASVIIYFETGKYKLGCF